MTDYRELLIGCGRARDKRVHVPGLPRRPLRGGSEWQNLTTLDLNPNCGAQLQCDLNAQPPWYVWTLAGAQDQPGADSARHVVRTNPEHSSYIAFQLLSDFWDEIHAYEVLEHLGQQGDAQAFFAHFSELYRLLKPGGYLCATVPSRFYEGLWGDPSHRRVVYPMSLVFLDQEQYQIQIDRRIAAGQPPTAMSDFRDTLNYRADFKLIDQHDNRTTFAFVLQAVKPSRRKV